MKNIIGFLIFAAPVVASAQTAVPSFVSAVVSKKMTTASCECTINKQAKDCTNKVRSWQTLEMSPGSFHVMPTDGVSGAYGDFVVNVGRLGFSSSRTDKLGSAMDGRDSGYSQLVNDVGVASEDVISHKIDTTYFKNGKSVGTNILEYKISRIDSATINFSIARTESDGKGHSTGDILSCKVKLN